MLTCGCQNDTNPKCSRRTCGMPCRLCVPGDCKCIGLEDNVKTTVTNGGEKLGDVQYMWMQNHLNVGSREIDEYDSSVTSDLVDSLEDFENDVT